jgi:hypothetical protein
VSACEFCPDGHEDPTRRPWAVYVHPSQSDYDGQPISLVVSKTGCQHVAESDAEWLRQVIRDARYRPTSELLRERNEAEEKLERLAVFVADLQHITGARYIADIIDGILFPGECECPGEHCGECGCCPDEASS